MSEHHHSLKRETFHETNPLLYKAGSKSTHGGLKGREGGETAEEGGDTRGSCTQFYKEKKKSIVLGFTKCWKEIRFTWTWIATCGNILDYMCLPEEAF